MEREAYLLHAYRSGIPYKTAVAAFRDNAIPGLWTHYKRIIKDNGCIALFAQPPFDVQLASSNESWYRYEWIVQKTRPTGHLNARKAPMKAHEKILIFYKKPPTYNPQKTEGHAPAHTFSKQAKGKTNYKQTAPYSGGGNTDRFPIDVLTFQWDAQQSDRHRNQKPVKMLEYFILTYTQPGDTVLDNTMGRGSTGVACIHTDRHFIGMEKQSDIYNQALLRIDTEIKQMKEGVVPYVEGNQTIAQTIIEGF